MAPGMPHALTWRDNLGFMCMVVGMFMAILDIQIVSASIAEIQAGLSASPDEAAWVQTSYLIAEIVMIPLSGFLSRALSTRVFYVLSALGFTLASALCATATSLEAMIAFRALQGFLGGGMIPTVFATAFLMFPPARRAQMSVLIGLTATLAPTIGPTLGGWLTQAMSWHWLFLINLPVGLAVAAGVWALIDIDRPEPGLLRRFDYTGLALMAAFLGSLEYVLEEGERNDWFEDDAITGFSVVAAVAAVLFFHRMLTHREPLVQLRAFHDRNFAFGCLFSAVIGIGLYGAVYVVPLFLGRVRGYDSMQIGATVFVTGVAQFLTAPLAGRLVRVLDLRVMLAFGLATCGASFWWLAHLTNQSAFWELFGPQALRGFALMFLFVPTNALALGTLPPAALKNASGLYNLMRNLGGAVGIAMIGTLATTRTALHTLHLHEQVSWVRPVATQALAGLSQTFAHARDGAALQKLALLVRREALTLAYNDVLLVMALCFFLAVPLTLLLARPRPAS
ncbi:Colistin resistance protein EmrB [Rhodovastum atsumiense]|uniref:DHA2 family efflux MFS transporter permease subunit n=1 Tax=Rhodovastum atsumiense TaxID=504468 RepID=A0A5M6IKQ9_9PROT|nr:DHA2 family efflux MFS transporter permease subunit [Rhodovastum atsumiense]KAA5608853.1 DHA2 family efflux MFS transporter permease subunit [Rhodovastum atsumiense]CAH2599317.1 Colistin resistance protein EmrB [Rhodovastum atsumiense]